jgi:hypothetical protein
VVIDRVVQTTFDDGRKDGDNLRMCFQGVRIEELRKIPLRSRFFFSLKKKTDWMCRQFFFFFSSVMFCIVVLQQRDSLIQVIVGFTIDLPN